MTEYLKVPESTLYGLMREGKVPCHKVGHHWRFRMESINRWLDQPTEPPLNTARGTAQ